jgi:hypothetical protein
MLLCKISDVETREKHSCEFLKQWICFIHYHTSDLETVQAGQFIMTFIVLYSNLLEVGVAYGEYNSSAQEIEGLEKMR